MAAGVLKLVITVVMLGGFLASAAATTVTATARMTTIRIEPTRPGGMPGEPRESSPFWKSDAGAVLSTKPALKRKGRRH